MDSSPTIAGSPHPARAQERVAAAAAAAAAGARNVEHASAQKKAPTPRRKKVPTLRQGIALALETVHMSRRSTNNRQGVYRRSRYNGKDSHRRT